MICQHHLVLFRYVVRLLTNMPASAPLQLAATLCSGDPSCTSLSRLCSRPPTAWCHHIHNDGRLSTLEALHAAQDRTFVTSNHYGQKDCTRLFLLIDFSSNSVWPQALTDKVLLLVIEQIIQQFISMKKQDVSS